MSANGNGNGDIPGRELAYRLFAAEYDDASLSYAESDEERAPNYVITPTGARVNRVFAVGTLTEVTSVNEEMVRARVVDPTGAFVVYAGQYQPDELAFLEGTEPPAFVAVTGKARTFQPDDSDQVYTSIRPESIATVDADTRDRWVVSAAERTIGRIGTYAGAAELNASGEALTDALLEAGIESGLAAGIPLAQDHYGTTASYLAALRNCALEACEVVAGDRDQVSGLDVAPDGTSPEFDATFASLADLDGVDIEALEAGTESETDSQQADPAAATAGGSDAAVEPEDAHSGSAAGTATSDGSGSTATTEIDAEPGTEATATDSATEPEAVASDSDTAEADLGADSSDDDSEPEGTDTDSATATAAEGDDATAAVDGTTADVSTGDEPDEEGEATEDDDPGDFDAGDVDDSMYEMDEEEREELEAEFGAEFTTGSEVDDPGEADIDVPEPEDDESGDFEADSAADQAESPTGDEAADPVPAEPDDDLGAPPESGLESAAVDESAVDESSTADEPEGDDSESDDEPADDVDLEAYVVETMEELDDGDGAARTDVIETVAADTGAGTDEVEDAIQDALMGGQCYEPDDETLKAI
jgi:RPA family protein